VIQRLRDVPVGWRLGGFLAFLFVANSAVFTAVVLTYDGGVRTAIDHAVAVARGMELVYRAQAGFRSQVDAWKDVVIQHAEPGAVARHRERFDGEAATVQDMLGRLRALAIERKLDHSSADRFLAAHAEVTGRYRAALAAVGGADTAGVAVAERDVRDVERRLVAEMAAMVSEVADKAATRRVAAEARLDLLRWGVLGLSALVTVFLIGSALVLTRGIVRPLARIVGVTEAAARGDFSERLGAGGRDELGRTAVALDAALGAVGSALGDVTAAAHRTSGAAQALAGSADTLAGAAQAQASSLEQSAASLEQMAATVKQNADRAQEANRFAVRSRETAEHGGAVVRRAVDAMADITTASKKIAAITTTIDEITFRTTLLGLNAAVEAARAGEQGRGFAVVAAEVRSLAQRAGVASKEIKTLIDDSVAKVDVGSEAVTRSGQTLEEIVASVKRVTDIVGEIATASAEQTTGIEQVNRAVAQMDEVVQGNASQTEQVSSTAQTLAGQAAELQALVARFRVGANGNGYRHLADGVEDS
jgi:methyl-accepting chemotaxis protein